MPWKNGYYYRSRREGARVKTEYVGAGYLAELAAEEDQARREAQELDRQERAAILADDKKTAAVIAQAGDLLAAVLLANGYTQQERHWRQPCRKKKQ